MLDIVGAVLILVIGWIGYHAARLAWLSFKDRAWRASLICTVVLFVCVIAIPVIGKVMIGGAGSDRGCGRVIDGRSGTAIDC
ncbi:MULTISPECIES: hypothetical protein [unclassified Mesorhizobium]|uniref:hypothetical protein n=1 Tax=unclassified Mesorhizobium TaxID=325217 RepID=UPI003014DDA2